MSRKFVIEITLPDEVPDDVTTEALLFAFTNTGINWLNRAGIPYRVKVNESTATGNPCLWTWARKETQLA